MMNAFTIDLEDWYQGVDIPFNDWNKYEKRLRIGFDKLIFLLQKKNIKATFFVLGKVIEDHPDIITEIIQEGHEIGCHTYSHPMLYKLDEDMFNVEINKCRDLISQFKTSFTGFRAPYFTVDHRNIWVLNSLKNFGFEYDSSIFPGDSKRTGIKNYIKTPHFTESGLLEFPVSTGKLGGFDFGMGGAYFRILPYAVFKNKFYALSQLQPVNFYIHPWELDPNHPRIKLSSRISIPHYWNLNSTFNKLDMLTTDFEFGPINKILQGA
jgi:polysaccharide deacetylase family protein (PEP-CTERM system associated)